jgi:hypothetical protein
MPRLLIDYNATRVRVSVARLGSVRKRAGVVKTVSGRVAILDRCRGRSYLLSVLGKWKRALDCWR